MEENKKLENEKISILEQLTSLQTTVLNINNEVD